MGRRCGVGKKKSLTTVKRKTATEPTLEVNDNFVDLVADEPVNEPQESLLQLAKSQSTKTSTVVPKTTSSTQALSPVIPLELDESPVKQDQDDFLLSQRAEDDFVVGWNSSSPGVSHAPGLDITDIIRRHATKKQRTPLSSRVGSPGLNNLWSISSPVSHHAAGSDGLSLGRRPSRGHRKSRTHSKSKATANCKHLLLKLAATAFAKNDEADTGVAASIRVSAASTPIRKSQRLARGEDGKNNQSAHVLFSESDPEDTAAGSKATTRIDTGPFSISITTPDNTKPQQQAGTPKTHKSDKSIDELWTDDEFDSDSILAATQEMLIATSLALNGSSKRRKDSSAGLEPQEKTGRYVEPEKEVVGKPAPQWKVPNIPASKNTTPKQCETKMPFNSYQAKNDLNTSNQQGNRLTGATNNSKDLPKRTSEVSKKPATSLSTKAGVSKSTVKASPSPKPPVSKPFVAYSNPKSVSSVRLKKLNEPSVAHKTKAVTGLSKKEPIKVPGKLEDTKNKANNFEIDPNTSISEDLLAALAEPDDILDSQACLFDTTTMEDAGKKSKSPKEEKQLVPQHHKQLVKVAEQEKAAESGSEYDDSDDLVPEDALLAVLEQAETQASQEAQKASKSSTTPAVEVSQLSLDVGSTFRPMMHSTQKLMPPPSHPPKPPANCNSTKQARLGNVNNAKPKPLTVKSSVGQQTSSKQQEKDNAESKASDSVASSQGVYSRDQIEQKRLEALQKRKSKLKLNAR